MSPPRGTGDNLIDRQRSKKYGWYWLVSSLNLHQSKLHGCICEVTNLAHKTKHAQKIIRGAHTPNALTKKSDADGVKCPEIDVF